MENYPFRVVGNTIVVNRYAVTLPGTEENAATKIYFVTSEGAEQLGGPVEELDVSNCDWMDGIVIPDSADPFAEAVRLYEMGEEVWRAERVSAKCAELSAACHAAIVAGCDVALEDGVTEHFSMAETDQINLTTALAAVERGAAGYPYHADGEICCLFSAADIQAIAQAATAHKLYHMTKCNHLLAWARRVETIEELETITYSAQLPEDLAEHMEEVMASATAL